MKRILSKLTRKRTCTANIVVFGTGRSGTTWLAEVFAAAGLKYIFEPLHPTEVPEAREIDFPNYLLPGDETPWSLLLSRVVAGEVENEWTLRANPDAERAVIKTIRANLMMEWMLDQFDMCPVYIIRNPLSVAGSMKEQGWIVGTGFVQRAMAAMSRRDGIFDGFDDLFDHQITDVESYAIMWGYQNYVPKRKKLIERVNVVRFEQLARDPEAVFGPLAARLGITVTEEVERKLHTLSSQPGKQSWGRGYDPVNAWRRSLTADEVRDVVRIVRRFDLEEHLPGDLSVSA